LISGGSVILASGTNHSLHYVNIVVGGTSHVYSCNILPGATLGGSASITYATNVPAPFNIQGDLSPGEPGSTGTFSLLNSSQGYLPNVTFFTGSALCIDLVSSDNALGDFNDKNHDIFRMKAGGYSLGENAGRTGSTLTFQEDAIIRLSGNIEEGIYNIIQLDGSSGSYVVVNPGDYAGVGTASWGDNIHNWMDNILVEAEGYDLIWHFETVTAASNNAYERITCIALVIDSVTIVPEPASLGFLGMGSALLLLRRKR